MKNISVIFLSLACISLLLMGKVSARTQQHEHQMKDFDVMHHEDMGFAGRENAVTQTSSDGLYKVSLFSNPVPIPLQKIHSWTLRIATADGKPAENLKIFVNGGMPMHRHGFPTKPKVSGHLGNGEYRVDGIKFNMVGHWEMRFNITEKNNAAGRGKEDRIIFKIHLK